MEKGMLADGGALMRCALAFVLALACLTSIVTQWGYVGAQFADGSVTYIMFMLVPVVLAALLLGTTMGAAAGLFSGTALYLHACIMPLDYYELVNVTPVTSIVAMTACGLVLGVLFSLVLRGKSVGGRRMLLLVLACLVASAVFSVIFEVGALWRVQAESQAYEAQITTGGVAYQAIGDAVVMALTMAVGVLLVERAGLGTNLAGLRAVFGARLLGVVLAAFMMVAMAAYGNVTAGKIVYGLDDMRSEADYLLDQVVRAAEYDQEFSHLLADGVGVADVDAGRMVTGLIEGYTEDQDGLMIVSVADRLLCLDTDRLDVSPADSLQSFLSEDVLAAVQRSVQNGTLEQVVYSAPQVYSGLVQLAPTGSGGELSLLETPQVGYLVALQSGDFQVILIRPAFMVFDGRDDVAGWITAASLGLLLAVSALVWWLLDVLVARRIDATNAVLARITEGDLEARVEPSDTFEFQELSVGVNQTVDTLQGWIAEAERRMDAELATARSIQGGVLPNVFPPYPDIQRFDIFASMSAAKEVGGDFYDFFLVGDDCDSNAGKLAFVMADVSGKGVPAALFMMRAKTQIRDYLESGMELGEAVENANRRLCEGNEEEGMFVTAWVGLLDYATGHVDYVNAGHNPPLLWQDGSWHWMKKLSGMPLGVFDELPYPTQSVDCAVGDQILLYTDGVTEAFAANEEQYGEGRLKDLLEQSATLHPREIVDLVRQSVASYSEGVEQSDDITILALEVGVPPKEKVQIVVPADIDEIAQVYAFIHAELDRRLCPVRVQNQLDVAVEELFVNSCNYAYEGMGPEVEPYVRVTCSYSANPVSITVEIIDGGVPFDPLSKSDDEKIDEFATLDDIGIGGLGILMAKNSVDEMRYERMGDINVVTLVKRW